MVIGSAGSAYFGVMVSLKEAMPGMFGVVGGVATGNIVWPTMDQWVVFGSPAFIEGIVPALSALLLSMFLHASVSHRLIEAEDKLKQIETRKTMKPFECPFCTYSDDTPAKLWGHFGRCPDATADPRPTDDKRALVRLAVDEGKKRNPRRLNEGVVRVSAASREGLARVFLATHQR